MEAIYLLIPIAMILVVVGIAVFFWAVKSDQFEDLEGPAHSILFDDEPKAEVSQPTTSDNSTNNKNEKPEP